MNRSYIFNSNEIIDDSEIRKSLIISESKEKLDTFIISIEIENSKRSIELTSSDFYDLCRLFDKYANNIKFNEP